MNIQGDFYVIDDHRKATPETGWRWPNFPPAEIACRGTGRIHISVHFMDRLQRLRERLGAPLIMNSVYRTPERNKAVGGADNSYHVRGMAGDVSMANHDPEVFVEAARACGFGGIGWYPPGKGNFIHIDIGRARTWGKPWKAPKHDPEPKAKMVSTPAKAGIAGTITLATAIEPIKAAVTPENLAAVQTAVQPMIAYSDVFQWVFTAAGVGIVAWTLAKHFLPRRAP